MAGESPGWWVVLVLCAACKGAPEVAPAAPTRPEAWVDGSASDEARRAFAPRAGFLTHVATGLYEVPSALPDDVEVVGSGTVVLHLSGPLELQRAAFRHVAFQGGEVGVRGSVRFEDVSFSGQRAAAVRVAEGASLVFDGGSIEGLVPETRGVVSRGHLELARVTLGGALRHGVTVETGDALISDSRSLGAAEAIHVSAGQAVVTRVHAEGGRGPAFAVHGGALTLRDVEVSGHEFAVLAGEDATLVVDGLRSERAALGAVSLVHSKGALSRLDVSRPGPHGAIESLDSQTRVEELTVRDANDIAVLVRLGRFDARRVRIFGVRAPDDSGGDGLMVRDAVADVHDLVVEDAAGSGVVATQVATLELDGLTCRRCAHGALLVERRANAKVRGVVAEGSREAAVTIADDGLLELDGLELKGEGPGVWAECTAGSRVVLRGKLPPRALLSGRCIEFPPAPPASGK